jgi:broad specificity phosphatase PhoE
MQTIYILRHFKVKDTTTKKLNSNEFSDWVELYDNTELEYLDIDISKVGKVYSSSQNRAVKTAEYLKLEFEQTELLKEVEAYPFINTQFRFSKNFWLIVSRVLWLFNLTKSERKRATIKRAKEFIQKIENEDNGSILVVSHGLFLKVLISELKKIGFDGDIEFRIKSGKIYELQYSE